MRLDQVMTLTAADIERRLDRMEVRQSATGKRHLFPDDWSGPGSRKVTLCGTLDEDPLQPPTDYRRPAGEWSKATLVSPQSRCGRCRDGWKARLDLVSG